MNPPNTQEAKVALVTGSARRVGAAIVQKLHATGYTVIIHYHRSHAQAQQLAAHLNNLRAASALVLQKNLCAPNSAQEIITHVSQWTGRLDLLVNNASVFIRTKCTSGSISEWDALFDTHVKVPFLLSIAARPLLAKQQGAIINITDIHSEKPLSGYSLYCQSKAALAMQTKSLAQEFAPEIRVNAIAPGAVAWPEQENSLDAATQEKIIKQTLLQRHGDPEFIAQAVLALAENRFITGQTLKVDGGRSIA